MKPLLKDEIPEGRFHKGKLPGYKFAKHEAQLSYVRPCNDNESSIFSAGQTPRNITIADYRVRFKEVRSFLPGFKSDVDRIDGTKVARDIWVCRYLGVTVIDPLTNDRIMLQLSLREPKLNLEVYFNEDRITSEAIQEATVNMMAGDDKHRIRASYILGKAVSEGYTEPLLTLTLSSGLSDEEPKIKTNCSWALLQMAIAGLDIKSTISELEKCVNCEHRDVRMNSTMALMIYYVNQNNLDGIDWLLNHPQRDVRKMAAELLPANMF